jgi:hypothetical protein
MKQPAAVIGIGQTHHRAKREDVSIAGLCREAVDRALAMPTSASTTSMLSWSARLPTCSRA